MEGKKGKSGRRKSSKEGMREGKWVEKRDNREVDYKWEREEKREVKRRKSVGE